MDPSLPCSLTACLRAPTRVVFPWLFVHTVVPSCRSAWPPFGMRREPAEEAGLVFFLSFF